MLSASRCHKQYASKAKLLQHQRKKHPDRVQSHGHASSRTAQRKVSVHAEQSAVSFHFCSVFLEAHRSLVQVIDQAHNHAIIEATDSMKFDEQDLQSLQTVVNGTGHEQHIPMAQSQLQVEQSSSVANTQATNNLITILGNINGLIALSNDQSVSSAELHELLQANPAAANDLLTQAMSELNKSDAAETIITTIPTSDAEVLWQ